MNLLTGSKSGDRMGDSRESARARHAFLEKGYYAPLREALVQKFFGTVLDICCGEGYYDLYDGPLYGFDLSKEMVRLAAKRKNGGQYFVANLARMPVWDSTVDTAIHLFAPFHGAAFSRVLKPGGRLFSVIPGRRHLWELKALAYDRPYENDEAAPQDGALKLCSRQRVCTSVVMPGADVHTLFSMTPYFYHTSASGRKKLETCGQLEMTMDFVMLEYKKCI